MRTNRFFALLLSICLSSTAFAKSPDKEQSGFFSSGKFLFSAVAAGVIGGTGYFYRNELRAMLRTYEIRSDIESVRQELAEKARKASAKGDSKSNVEAPQVQCASGSSMSHCTRIAEAIEKSSDGSTVTLQNGVLKVKPYKKSLVAKIVGTVVDSVETRESEAATIARDAREDITRVYFELLWDDEANAEVAKAELVSALARQARADKLKDDYRKRDKVLLAKVIEKQKNRGSERYTNAQAVKDAAVRKYNALSEETKELARDVAGAVAKEAAKGLPQG